jgi:hypothetical protein
LCTFSGAQRVKSCTNRAGGTAWFFLPDSLRYDRAAIVDTAATFTDDPSGAPTWVQVHVSGHLGWPAGVGYRVVALTPPGAVRQA